MSKIGGWFSSLSNSLGADGIVVLFIAINVTLFVVVASISLVKKKKIFTPSDYAVFSCFNFSLFFAWLSALTNLDVFTALTLTLLAVAVTFLIFFFLQMLKFADGDERKVPKEDAPSVERVDGYEFLRRLNEKMQRQESETVIKCEQKQEKPSLPSLDFSHVKSVIDRLYEYELAPQDRRKLKEIETSVAMVSGGLADVNEKRKLNDLLSSLLKIMAKYGA